MVPPYQRQALLYVRPWYPPLAVEPKPRERQFVHNVLVHPLIGVAYAVADSVGLPRLARWADDLHDRTAPQEMH